MPVTIIILLALFTDIIDGIPGRAWRVGLALAKLRLPSDRSLLTQWGAVIVPDLKTIAPQQFYNASNPATYSRG